MKERTVTKAFLFIPFILWLLFLVGRAMLPTMSFTISHSLSTLYPYFLIPAIFLFGISYVAHRKGYYGVAALVAAILFAFELWTSYQLVLILLHPIGSPT